VTPRVLEFTDLAGPVTGLSSDDDRWLAELAAEARPNDFAIPFARRHPDDRPGVIVERDGNSWRAGRYIGQLRRGDRILTIRPRLGIDTIGEWMAAITGVVAVARAAAVEDSADLLVAPIVARLWAASVRQASQHGLPTFRAESHAAGSTVRGRLDGKRTAVLAARGATAIAWTERTKSLDNPVSRSIVAADNVLGRLLDHSSPRWRGDRTEEIVTRIRHSVGNRPKLPTRRQLDRVRYTPIRLPFRPVAELSWSIAQFGGIQNTPSGDDIEGMLIDVAELWELFVLHCAREAFASIEVAHGTFVSDAAFLMYSAADPAAGRGRLLPDVIVGPRATPCAIIDAKYKRLSGDYRDPDRGDLYQLAAYLSASTTDICRPAGMLAYPIPVGSEAFLGTADIERHGPWLTMQGNNVQFVRLPVGTSDCVAALRRHLPVS
jgi:5-methylcytosine-specific restriction enzyme subunit McrC